MARSLVVLLIGTGCTSSAATPPDTAHSGARLKLAWYEFADGMRTWGSPTDLVDAELAAPCEPTRWADGVTRCTPEASGVFFLDAACTQPALLVEARYGIETVAGCHAAVPTGSVQVGSGQTIVVMQYYLRREPGECDQVLPDPRHGSFRFQTVAQTLPASRLVTTTIAHQGSGDIVVATLQGDDGLLVPMQLYDAAHHMTCDAAQLANAIDGPCFATESAVSDVFADAGCAQPAVQVEPLCDRPALARMPTLGCPLYFEVGDHRTTGDTYQDAFGVCHPSMTGDQPAYPLGAAVDAIRLARAPEPSALREQLIYVAGGGARVRDVGRIYDSALMAECTLDSIGDGGTATCRPRGRPADNLFSDPRCTQPLPRMIAADQIDGCTTQAPPAVVDGGDHVYRAGALHAGDVYEALVGACRKADVPLYDLGEPIDVAWLRAAKRRDS